MRSLAVLLAVAGCMTEAREPVLAPAPELTPTFEVAFVDTLGGAPATHIAVGGKLRVRVPDAATSTNAVGPFAITTTGDNTLEITATGEGAGVIEIETFAGYTRFAVTAAPIASVAIVLDPKAHDRGRVALRDAAGNDLVDASLRVAPGSAPVVFTRDAWDRIALSSSGDVLVKTDLLPATRGVVERVSRVDVALRR